MTLKMATYLTYLGLTTLSLFGIFVFVKMIDNYDQNKGFVMFFAFVGYVWTIYTLAKYWLKK